MTFEELVRANRSYRRFQESQDVAMEVLEGLVDLARLSPSGHNRQPLKFMICNNRDWNARIFPHLGWASHLPEWPGPIPGERPSAYILVLGDRSLSREFGYDPGIACQSILLGATSRGLGGCIIGSAKRDLRQVLDLPASLELLLVIALGKPIEEVRIEPVGPDGSIKYWRDPAGVHHLPKRALDAILLPPPGSAVR